jgi:hypothetical protein
VVSGDHDKIIGWLDKRLVIDVYTHATFRAHMPMPMHIDVLRLVRDTMSVMSPQHYFNT